MFSPLHRPDALMEAEGVAEAFLSLGKSGKVRHFGVSNQTFTKMELLQSIRSTASSQSIAALSCSHAFD